MIRFMYFNNLPNDFEIKTQGLGLLKLANQFEYIELKQNLEADLIEAKYITAENAVDTLVVAAVQFFLGESLPSTGRWLTPVASMLMWPVVVAVLKGSERKRGYMR